MLKFNSCDRVNFEESSEYKFYNAICKKKEEDKNITTKKKNGGNKIIKMYIVDALFADASVLGVYSSEEKAKIAVYDFADAKKFKFEEMFIYSVILDEIGEKEKGEE